MPDYSYLPLRQNDAIRLLELLPGTRDDPQVHCNITRRRLSDKSLRYEAISYTWGNSENRETLLCGGFRAELSITRNCYNALCSLRQAAQPRLLWIDAVCINQDDISERNAQVRIMDQIYANATQVVAYLGEESAGSHILFHELALADHLYQSTGSFEGRPKPSIETVNELELLLQRPWWFRIWVLQEVHVARQVTAMCGNSQASMKALDGCVFGYRYNRVTERFAPPPLYAFDNGWYFKPTRNQRDVAVFTLWQLLWTTRACKATDPRDRVLALIPFLTETRHELAHLIDYSRTVEQIFTDVALFLVDYLGLLVLGAVQHPHAREMPSWVADWSGDSVSTAWGSKDEPPITTERGFTVCRLACYHKACKGQHPVLRVQGVRIARIGHLGGHFDFENAREQCWETIRQVLDLQQVTSGYVPNEIDQGYNNDYGVMLTPLIYGKLCSLGRQHRYWLLGNALPDSPTERKETESELHNHRLFVTADGTIGCAPKETLESDILCALRATSTPVILRERIEGGWTVVSGNCYVHGDLAPSDDHDFLSDYVDAHSEQEEEFLIW